MAPRRRGSAEIRALGARAAGDPDQGYEHQRTDESCVHHGCSLCFTIGSRCAPLYRAAQMRVTASGSVRYNLRLIPDVLAEVTTDRRPRRVLMLAPEPFFEPRGTPFSEYHRIEPSGSSAIRSIS